MPYIYFNDDDEVTYAEDLERPTMHSQEAERPRREEERGKVLEITRYYDWMTASRMRRGRRPDKPVFERDAMRCG